MKINFIWRQLLIFSVQLYLAYTLSLKDQETISSDDFLNDYSAALEDAKNPTSDKIVKSLIPLRKDNEDLTFDSDGKVLMVFLGKLNDFQYDQYEEIRIVEDTFMTAYPEVKDICSTFESDDIKLELIQTLGMSPYDSADGVIEIYVDLSDIFRPCPDPDIADMECQTEIPLSGSEIPYGQDIPWYCPEDGESISQISGDWVQVSEDHFSWMCDEWESSYNNEDIYDNRPWTGLGYTYNWGSYDHVGCSEFAILAYTYAVFNQKMSIEDYCNNN